MMSEAALGEKWRKMAKEEGHRKKHPRAMSDEEKRSIFGDYIAPRSKEFMKCVDLYPYSTSNFIGKKIGLPRHTTNATLNRLSKNGLMCRVKDKDDLWVYFVTREQKARAKI